jgi:hypothetical protein
MDFIFTVLAKLIWGFDILQFEGQKYGVHAYEGALFARPKPFLCYFKFRSERHREVFEREVEVAEGVLDKFPPFE